MAVPVGQGAWGLDLLVAAGMLTSSKEWRKSKYSDVEKWGMNC